MTIPKLDEVFYLVSFWLQRYFEEYRLGRLVISQNKKQAAVSIPEAGKQYSYMQYDYIGRITEVGQITNAGSTPITDSISRSQSLLTNWITASVAGKEEITSTIYDLPYAGFTGITPQPTTQRNLRNRVSYTTYALGANPAQYNQGSFFTYDALGNVDTLLQDYGASNVTATQNGMNSNGNRFKKMVYQFDLISGKVNSVAYQANQADQFYHRYTYDAENRLTLAETSSDSIVWERDARYQYYKHGPLARMVIGDQLVQGIDYAYTVQGWLKGVNSISVLPDRDMGRDGHGVTGQNQNQYVAKDAFGFNLNYFTGDYSTISPISVSLMPFSNSTSSTNFKALYNGNIGSMAVNINGLTVPGSAANAGGGMIYNYTYDQLNRLTAMDVYRGLSVNTWTPVARSEFKERITYDANGNILKYFRNGNSTSKLLMDSLTYKYYAGTNRLSHVRDSVPDGDYGLPGYEDIDRQDTSNYAYDPIGNLSKDVTENITNITWNVYGKITTVTYSNTANSTLKNLYYYYDASGNRMGKRAEKYNSAGVINSEYTWYVRDASGNVMATYSSTATGSSMPSNLALKERHVYGSSRLGIFSLSKDVKTPIPAYPLSAPYTSTLSRGYKFYELTNHLGNVLVTISDKKPGHSTNGTTIDYYDADQVSASDYYPFGATMPSRSNGSYRYGFNGKEKEKDGDGGSLQIDYGNRIYDPHLGRFKSVDRIASQYPELTPYQFASNSPIAGIDLDGLELLPINTSMYRMVTVSHTGLDFTDKGKIEKITYETSKLVTQYNNIPDKLKDPSIKGFRFVTGGMVGTNGRDYDSKIDGDVIFDPSRYNVSGRFNGSASEGTSTQDIVSLRGNAIPGKSAGNNGSVLGKNGLVGIGQNFYFNAYNMALGDERIARSAFYSATNIVDDYLKRNAIKDVTLTGISGRNSLINFLTDGTLPNDGLNAKDFSILQLENSLRVAYTGYQIILQNNIGTKPGLADKVSPLNDEYIKRGGKLNFSKANDFAKPTE